MLLIRRLLNPKKRVSAPLDSTNQARGSKLDDDQNISSKCYRYL